MLRSKCPHSSLNRWFIFRKQRCLMKSQGRQERCPGLTGKRKKESHQEQGNSLYFCLSVCVSLPISTAASVSLAHGSTQLPPNGTCSSRVYEVILEFLILCNRPFFPKEIKRYTKSKSRGSWLSENVFGLPSKRGPGLGSFSRADRGIGGVRPVAPPTWLVSNFLVRPASS